MKHETSLRFALFLFLIISYLHGIALNVSNAQDIALDHANKYFKLENYEQAITEYKRFIFFNPDNEMIGDVYYKLGLSYCNLGNFSVAIDAIKESVTLTFNDSIKDARRLYIAILSLAEGNFSSAEFELLRIAHFSNYSYLKRKAFFFLGVRYLYTFNWEEAKEAFKTFFSDSSYNITYNINVDSLIAPSINLKQKSTKMAKWLSTFLPGSGQIYCGDWRNGINAFALNSLLGYALIKSILEPRYIDILFVTYPFFRRFYTGNRDNSEMIAKLYNENNNKLFAKNILQQIQQQVNVNEHNGLNAIPRGEK